MRNGEYLVIKSYRVESENIKKMSDTGLKCFISLVRNDKEFPQIVKDIAYKELKNRSLVMD